MSTLAIDIGGGSIKLLELSDDCTAIGSTQSQVTPKPASPEAVLSTVLGLAKEFDGYERASVGFPGVVKAGITHNAPNLGNELWHMVTLAQELERRLEVPVRAINDADLQGLGVIEGHGVELALTLGTGLGSGLFVDGRLVPNLELGHHPLREDKTYEDLVRDSEFKRIGAGRWSKRVHEALAVAQRIFNYDRVHLGGGNAPNLVGALPANARCFPLEEALRGAGRLWERD